MSNKPCNMAKMREALIGIRKELVRMVKIYNTPLDGIESYVSDGLSAPIRNCDRFADELDAQLAFLNEVWLISVERETMLERDKYEKWTDEMRKRYGRWLYAPMTEQKGDAK